MGLPTAKCRAESVPEPECTRRALWIGVPAPRPLLDARQQEVPSRKVEWLSPVSPLVRPARWLVVERASHGDQGPSRLPILHAASDRLHHPHDPVGVAALLRWSRVQEDARSICVTAEQSQRGRRLPVLRGSFALDEGAISRQGREPQVLTGDQCWYGGIRLPSLDRRLDDVCSRHALRQEGCPVGCRDG